jgi:hypothetical protein
MCGICIDKVHARRIHVTITGLVFVSLCFLISKHGPPMLKVYIFKQTSRKTGIKCHKLFCALQADLPKTGMRGFAFWLIDLQTCHYQMHISFTFM